MFETLFGLRTPRAWQGYVSPFICFNDPGAPSPPPPPPPPPPPVAVADPIPVTPPPPPRAPGQTDADRLVQLEEINANLRVEAAGRRISERDAKDKIAANEREMGQLRADAEARITAARGEGEAKVGKIKSRTIDAELRAQATAAGLRDLDLLPLIDRSGLACDDEGNVTGVTEAVAALKTKKPDFFQVTARQPERVEVRTGAPAPRPPGPGAPAPAGADVRGMDKTQYNATKKAALSGLRG